MITAKAKNKQEVLEAVVIRFVGDSGDGMQLTGSQFSDTSAMFGNDVATSLTIHQKLERHKVAYTVYQAFRYILVVLKLVPQVIM